MHGHHMAQAHEQGEQQPQDAGSLFEGSTKLRSLAMAGYVWHDAHAARAAFTSILGVLPSLAHLTAFDAGGWVADPLQLSVLTSLHCLRLQAAGSDLSVADKCGRLGAALACMPHLTELALGNWEFASGPGDEPSVQPVFEPLRGLQCLRIEHNGFIAVNQEWHICASHLTSLRELHCAGSSGFLVDPQMMRHMFSQPTLQHLELQYCKFGGAAPVQALAECATALTALTWLGLKKIAVGDSWDSRPVWRSFMLQLTHLCALRHLNLNYCQVGRFVPECGDLSALKHLEDLRMCTTELDADGMAVLAAAFASMPALRYADLRYNPCFYRGRQIASGWVSGGDSSFGSIALQRAVGKALSTGWLSIEIGSGTYTKLLGAVAR